MLTCYKKGKGEMGKEKRENKNPQNKHRRKDFFLEGKNQETKMAICRELLIYF